MPPANCDGNRFLGGFGLSFSISMSIYRMISRFARPLGKFHASYGVYFGKLLHFPKADSPIDPDRSHTGK